MILAGLAAVSAEKLVSYLGPASRVRQSGDRAAQHGRISKHV
jgi:hypothetical protein